MAYYLEGDLTVRGVFCVTALGGLYLEVLIHRGTCFQNFTVIILSKSCKLRSRSILVQASLNFIPSNRRGEITWNS